MGCSGSCVAGVFISRIDCVDGAGLVTNIDMGMSMRKKLCKNYECEGCRVYSGCNAGFCPFKKHTDCLEDKKIAVHNHTDTTNKVV